MINTIIDDINRALKNDAYLSALALALTLPDICGKAAYPNEKTNGVRYKKWYDENIGKYEKDTSDDSISQNFPYLSGEVVYQLRNAILHQGTPNIDKEKITEERNKIDHFIITIEKEKEYDPYIDSALVSNASGEYKRCYRVNVRRLCYLLTTCAKAFYEQNKNRFDFIQYELMDLDKEIEKMDMLYNRQPR